MSTNVPSAGFGCRRAVELWRVVLAVYLGSVAVFVPVVLVLWTSAAGTIGSLPDGDLPDGELALIVVELLRPIWPALALATASSIVSLWAWTVLWHAGVVRWFVYSGKRHVRLAEIFSRGLFGWWRWARLGLAALTALTVVEVGLVLVYRVLRSRAIGAADDSVLAFYLESTLLLGVLAATVCWLATLRGAWLLGDVNRKSAVLAWVAGLRGTMTEPFRSLTALVLWVVPGLAAAILPLLAGWCFEVFRGGFANTLVSIGAGLLGAFCLAGLFLSFAPVSGLTRTDHKA